MKSATATHRTDSWTNAFATAVLLLLVHAVQVAQVEAQNLAGPPPPGTDQSDEILQARLATLDYLFQSQTFSAALNASLGVPFPVNASGIGQGANVTGVRLLASTLQQNGFVFFEFSLPPGLVVSSNASQLLLLYRNFSVAASPYVLPTFLKFSAPIAGLEVYPIANIQAASLPSQLAVAAPPSNPILVSFSNTNSSGQPSCVQFDSMGTPLSSNTSTTVQSSTAVQCQAQTLGDFTIIISLRQPPPPSTSPAHPSPTIAPPPVPSSPPGGAVISAPPPPAPPPPQEDKKGSGSDTVAIAVGAGVGGGIVVLCLIVVLGLLCSRAARKARIARLHRESDKNVPFETAFIGGGRAPTAGSMRTRAVPEFD